MLLAETEEGSVEVVAVRDPESLVEDAESDATREPVDPREEEGDRTAEEEEDQDAFVDAEEEKEPLVEDVDLDAPAEEEEKAEEEEED